MHNASPLLPLASPAIQHAVTDVSRQPSINPQHDSFENSNTARYLRRTQPFSPRQLTRIAQAESGHVRSHTPDEHSSHQSTENQVWPHIPHGPMLPRRYTGTVFSLADIRPATSVATNTAWLEEALNELAACPADALDEGLEEPSELGLTKAERLLREVSIYVTDRPDIYQMDEGSIAIDFRNPEIRAGVLFLIEHNGSGALFYQTRKSKGRLRVDDATDLLSEGGLQELNRVGIK